MTRQPARHPVCVVRHPKAIQLDVWPQATIRPGRGLAGVHVNVVWVRLDMGAGPEWLPMGTIA